MPASLLALLLQTPLSNAAPPVAVPAWLAPAISLGALLLALYVLVRKEQREDGLTTSQRLKSLEKKVGEHDTQRQGEAQARERIGETLLREYGAFKESIERRTGTLETKANEMQGLRERMVKIETELQSLPRIEASVKQMNDLLMKFLTDK